jgi:FKBP-type peptidyl-prolyl cis-trans isomerase 2
LTWKNIHLVYSLFYILFYFIIIFVVMKKLFLLVLSLCSVLVITGCGKKSDTPAVAVVEQTAANGDTVAVNYTLTIADGTVKDTSLEEVAKKSGLLQTGRKYEPLVFPIGQKKMIPGFEAGVIGMKVGENKKITVIAADGYGEKNDKMVQSVSGSVFKDAGITPKIGETFNFSFAPGKIIAISGDMVMIDFNHPLAGEVLTFDVTLMTLTKGWAGTGVVLPTPSVQ